MKNTTSAARMPKITSEPIKLPSDHCPQKDVLRAAQASSARAKPLSNSQIGQRVAGCCSFGCGSGLHDPWL
jgi:hypothetical protein